MSPSVPFSAVQLQFVFHSHVFFVFTLFGDDYVSTKVYVRAPVVVDGAQSASLCMGMRWDQRFS